MALGGRAGLAKPGYLIRFSSGQAHTVWERGEPCEMSTIWRVDLPL